MARADAIGTESSDDALFEVAHLVADLSRVDGTVIMTDCLEALGFGVDIAAGHDNQGSPGSAALRHILPASAVVRHAFKGASSETRWRIGTGICGPA
jgi:hypothetical protein